jgi:3-oxoacyl-[acyl-carrier protein] reductase
MNYINRTNLKQQLFSAGEPAFMAGGEGCRAGKIPIMAFGRLQRDDRCQPREMKEGAMASLEGRIALVTGASQGIGRAVALELARAGATVAVAARNEAKLAEVVAEIEGAGGKAAAFALDVASEESIKSGAKAVLERFGKVEILVNNAGITRDGLAMAMKRADWDDVLTTNLTGAFLLTQAVLRPMLKNRWGRIVNISSVVGRTGQGGQVNYAASKAGLIGLTRSLAREVASRGITVNAVAPGYIETAMTAVVDEKQRTAMMAAIPLGRAGTDVEIAQSVAFLASEGAGYITGHVLDVNGGMFMG